MELRADIFGVKKLLGLVFKNAALSYITIILDFSGSNAVSFNIEGSIVFNNFCVHEIISLDILLSCVY